MRARPCVMDCGQLVYGPGDICARCTALVARQREKKMRQRHERPEAPPKS